jgi:hypothetical protein
VIGSSCVVRAHDGEPNDLSGNSVGQWQDGRQPSVCIPPEFLSSSSAHRLHTNRRTTSRNAQSRVLGWPMPDQYIGTSCPQTDGRYGVLGDGSALLPCRPCLIASVTSIANRQWVRVREAAGLPKDLVLYCARHDYGSFVLRTTGNMKVVMDMMGQEYTWRTMRPQANRVKPRMVRQVYSCP